jgi:hypothetical protein
MVGPVVRTFIAAPLVDPVPAPEPEPDLRGPRTATHVNRAAAMAATTGGAMPPEGEGPDDQQHNE